MRFTPRSATVFRTRLRAGASWGTFLPTIFLLRTRLRLRPVLWLPALLLWTVLLLRTEPLLRLLTKFLPLLWLVHRSSFKTRTELPPNWPLANHVLRAPVIVAEVGVPVTNRRIHSLGLE